MKICSHGKTFIFGVGVGAAAGVLLAPKAGSEIRRELFQSRSGIFEEPGAGMTEPGAEEVSADLKAKIEETRARLKAEIEEQQEG